MASSAKTPKKSTKSIVEYRSSQATATLSGALIETERSIADMTRVFAELPSSNQRDVGGREKLTTRQKAMLAIIGKTQRRADGILNLIRRGEAS